MKKWSAKKNVDVTKLRIGAEDGYVLSRMSGPTSTAELIQMTGMSKEKILGCIERLSSEGALNAHGVESNAQPPSEENEIADDIVDDPDAGLQTLEEPRGSDEDEYDSDDDSDAPALNYRKVYDMEYADLTVEQRVKAARTVTAPQLCALCFDPDPRVARAVMESQRVGLPHARLLSKHHRTGLGLAALSTRPQLLRDRSVLRGLFRNPQMPDRLFQKVMQNKRLMDLFKLVGSREIGSKTKQLARRLFRKRFQTGDAEEKAALILKTEGRCLQQLSGITLDARTTAQLVQRSIRSTLLIQNFARWSSTPPKLLVHLSKQAPCRRQANLRQLLARHSNAPASLKRPGGAA